MIAVVEELPEQLRDPVPPVTNKPSGKPVRVLVVLQARLVEEEARRAIPGVDGDEVPFRIVIIKNHHHAPREIRAVVELLVGAVQEAD